MCSSDLARCWFRNELRHLPREILLDPRSLNRGWFRQPAIEQLISDNETGNRDNTNKLWALIQLELWLRTFIDTTPATMTPPALSLAGNV